MSLYLSTKVPGVQTYPTIKSFCNPNQSIRLVCRIDNQPFEGWFDTYGRKILPLTHGNRMMVENHYEYQVLVMKNVTAKDGGKYTCQGALDSASVNVNVNRTIAEYEHPTMLYPGQAGLFLQNIQCYPLPRFMWYKRGRPLDLSSDRYSVSPSGSLGIRRIRSSDMGVYTLKIQMGEQMRDTGVKVAAAVDGVDFTEWQDTLAPGATVQCQKDVMYIDLDRKSLIGYSAVDLSLQNTSCRATSNETHYSLKAPLVGCGTEIKFTPEAVVYTNMVKEYRSADGMITRIQDIRIPFSCFYTKEGVTSTFGVLPTKVAIDK
ncbi:hypothetical protein QZH41_005560 [Actinostola sp. cb2023]|nr:hypothetical protein QZH41_005560 [Actinostola sp. cb2023]